MNKEWVVWRRLSEILEHDWRFFPFSEQILTYDKFTFIEFVDKLINTPAELNYETLEVQNTGYHCPTARRRVCESFVVRTPTERWKLNVWREARQQFGECFLAEKKKNSRHKNIFQSTKDNKQTNKKQQITSGDKDKNEGRNNLFKPSSDLSFCCCFAFHQV